MITQYCIIPGEGAVVGGATRTDKTGIAYLWCGGARDAICTTKRVLLALVTPLASKSTLLHTNPHMGNSSLSDVFFGIDASDDLTETI